MKQAISNKELLRILAELEERCKYFRSLDSDYFDGPLRLDDLESLIDWIEVMLLLKGRV